MHFEYLNEIIPYGPYLAILLIISGFAVGFINTLAGSGTIINYWFFLYLGLDPGMANGSTRMGVIMQTLAASLTFKRSDVLDIKTGLRLGVPTTLGSVWGAQVAIGIDKSAFNYIVGAMMLLMLVLLLINPNRWIEGSAGKGIKLPYLAQFILYLAIGFYGGFLHIGVGIFLLAALVLISGYDLLRANALKVFIVLIYSPFALAVFIWNGQVDYGMAILASVGNVVGGILASRVAVKKGARFIHWFLVAILILFSAHTFGLF